MKLFKIRKSQLFFLLLTFVIPKLSAPAFSLTTGTNDADLLAGGNFYNTIGIGSTPETFVPDVMESFDESNYQEVKPPSKATEKHKNLTGDSDQEDIEDLTRRLVKELEDKLGLDEILRPSESGKAQNFESHSSTGYTTNSVTMPSQAEYNALIDFYQSTGGANWINNTGWSTANPNVVQSVQGWSGIMVDHNGHVTHIHLNGNNLSGTLPESIKDLEYLITLRLPLNNLTGQLPNVFHQMPNLKDISIDQNQLSGSIPQSIGYSSTLESIQLSSNSLTGNIPSYLNNLTSLKYLILNNNQLTGSIPQSIGALTNLKLVYLYRNDLTGSIPSSIGNLINLDLLDLHQNHLSGVIPPTIGNMQELKSFYISDNEVEGSIPSSIGNLSKLQLVFFYNNKLSGQIPASFGNLKQVIFLLLMENQLTGSIPAQLGSMTSLQYLNLSKNKLGGNIPSQLGSLSNLTTLRLDYNELTGQLPSSLCSLPNLHLFYALMNRLEGEIPSCLLTNGPELFWISHNYYGFEDLVNKTQYWSVPYYYSPQRTDPELTNYTVNGSGGIVLSTQVGKNLGNPSSYQWYKDGHIQTTSSPSNDTVTLNCPALGDGTFDCTGSYFADVTNPGYPTIVLRAAGPETEGDDDDDDSLEIQICFIDEFDMESNLWFSSKIGLSQQRIRNGVYCQNVGATSLLDIEDARKKIGYGGVKHLNFQAKNRKWHTER